MIAFMILIAVAILLTALLLKHVKEDDPMKEEYLRRVKFIREFVESIESDYKQGKMSDDEYDENLRWAYGRLQVLEEAIRG